MIVEKLRKDSRGIEAALDNAAHHAPKCVPLIQSLIPYIKDLGFQKWIQGNNIHAFVTHDGRRFDIVGYAGEGGYEGLQIRLRESRSKATPLMVMTDVLQQPMVVQFLQALAKQHPENKRNKLKYSMQ